MAGLHEDNEVSKSLHTFDLESDKFSALVDNPMEKIESANLDRSNVPQEHQSAATPSQNQSNPADPGYSAIEHASKASTPQVTQLQSNADNGHEQSSDLLAHQEQGPNVYQRKSERQLGSPAPQVDSRVGTPPRNSGQGQRSRLLTMSSQGDISSDEDRAHSMSSTDTSAASGRAVNRARSNLHGMDVILQQHNVSPHASRRYNPQYQPTSLRNEILNQEGSEFEHLASDHHVHSPFDQDPVQMTHSAQPYHGMGRCESVPVPHALGMYPMKSSYYSGKSQSHQPHAFLPAHGLPSSQSPIAASPFMSGDSYQSMQHGVLDPTSRGHGVHMGQAAQHLLPYRGDPNVHLRYKEKGYGALKREGSSPELNFQSLREQPHHAYVTKMPEERNLADLEPDPFFPDEEDRQRIDKIYIAMMDEDQAQDNDGMKRTWKALRKDRAKLQSVCRKVLNACYVSQNISTPLQQSVKPQHHYETLDDRVDAICEAFKQQKTMCKHLMEAPYLYQVVDDPNLAALRVINNRKVNQGKKEAIEQGRKALAKQKAKKQLGQNLKAEVEDDVYNDFEDAEFEEDDEGNWEEYSARAYSSPGPVYPNSMNKRMRQTPARQISSEDSADPTYRGPIAKRARKNSKYQLNERNEMVDTSEIPKERRVSQPASRRAMQNRRSVSHYQPHLRSNIYNSTTEVDTDSAIASFSNYSDNGPDDDYQPGGGSF